MDIENALRELGKAIQSDERFVALHDAAATNDKNELLQDKMHEMQLLSMQYQQESAKGEEADSDKINELQEKYQNIYNEIMDYDDMKNYSAAASKVDEMAQYISKMIGKFFDGENPETCSILDDDCTHNCATCAGCF